MVSLHGKISWKSLNKFPRKRVFSKIDQRSKIEVLDQLLKEKNSRSAMFDIMKRFASDVAGERNPKSDKIKWIEHGNLQ